MQGKNSNTQLGQKKDLMKRVSKDPLFHFLIIGGALFFASSMFGTPTRVNNEIVVTTLKQKHLADLFEITWQRTPNDDELKNLIQEYIKEEIYYREALALGLDQDDTIVRRRMRQKLEFMHEDAVTTQSPSIETLKAYFKDNAIDYKTDPIYSFEQILVSKSKNNTAVLVSNTLAKIRGGVSPLTLSKSSLLPVKLEQETARSIKNTFGDEFLTQLSNLSTKEWHGPLTSPFGTHLVYVSVSQKAEPLNFTRARHKIEINYMQEKREKLTKQYYDDLQKQYHINIVEKQ